MTAAARQERPDLDLVRRMRDNRVLWWQKCCLVEAKEAGQIVPFLPNRAQLKLDALMDEQIHRQGKVRLLIPKARQLGISLHTQMRFLHVACNHRGFRAQVVAHDAKTGTKMFRRTRITYGRIPSLFRPAAAIARADQMEFSTGSTFSVITAGSEAADSDANRKAGTGRGDTNHLLHLSEAAYYPSGEIVHALLDTVPKAGRTEVAIESTGAGQGGVFYDMVLKAEGGDLPGWQVAFLPWTLDDDYRVPPPRDWEPPPAWLEYAILHGLDLDQVYWAYLTAAEKAATRPELPTDEPNWLFRQEYPITLEECFQGTTERQLIPAEHVQAARKTELERDDTAPPVLGVDIGRSPNEGDKNVIIDRRGRRLGLEVYERFPSADLMHTTGRVVEAIGKVNPRRVFVDVTGIGAGVVDRLCELGYSDIVVGVNFGGVENVIEPLRFVNKRAEMWVNLAEWYARSGQVQCVDDTALQTAVCAVKADYDSQSRYKLEDKAQTRKRIGRSPDEGDAAALTFAERLAPIIPLDHHRRAMRTKFVGS